MSRFLTRRRLLAVGGGAVVLGTGAALGSIPVCNAVRADLGRAAERLAVALPDIHAPERLADWWLTTQDAAELPGLLDAHAGLDEARRVSCAATRRSVIASHVRADFRAGDILLADRIVTSRTECLVAALCIGYA